jgi:hypothetical protein
MNVLQDENGPCQIGKGFDEELHATTTRRQEMMRLTLEGSAFPEWSDSPQRQCPQTEAQ